MPQDHVSALWSTPAVPTCRHGLGRGAISAWGRALPPLPWHLERDTVDGTCVSKRKAGLQCPPAQFPLARNRGPEQGQVLTGVTQEVWSELGIESH